MSAESGQQQEQELQEHYEQEHASAEPKPTAVDEDQDAVANSSLQPECHPQQQQLLADEEPGVEEDEEQQQQQQQQLSPGGTARDQRQVPDVLTCAGVVVRNRGTLAAAARQRQQQQLTQQEQLVQEWQAFAGRQAQRYVPAPPSPSRRVLQESVCYRLRVLHVDNLPPPQLSSGVKYGLQLGVTLFDSTAGAFFGSTCYSLVEPLQGQLQEQPEAPGPAAGSEPSVDFSFDVFFHSCIADAACMAVVELILAELEEDGSCSTKFSAGWAQLPLFISKGKGMLNKQQTPASAPAMSGTPRYLQLRAVCGDQLPPAAVLGGCMVAYQVEAYPVMNPARPLLPQDFLVSHTDLIPGLRRFDLAGQPTTALHSSLNTIASPLLAPPCAVSLEGVQVVVPQLLHNLLSVLPQLLGSVPPPDLASLLSVPCQPEAVAYSLRLRVHNGRTFVGPWVTAQLQVQPHLGSLVLCPGQGLDVTWLPQDRLLVLVLEMLAAPTAAADAADADGAAAAVGTVLVGRSVLAPFTAISADGGVAALAEGRHRLCFDSSSCMGSFNSSSCWAPKGCSTSMLASSSGAGEAGDLLLPLNWRAMLADTATRSVPDPAVQLDLQPCSRMGAEQPETAAKLAAAATAAAPVAAAAAASVAATSGKKASAVVVHAAAQTALPAAHSPAVSVEVVRPAAPPVAPAPVAEQVHQPVPEVYESPAARSLKLAAQHLEQAANIPVQTPSATTYGGESFLQGPRESQADTASRQQLQQLAEAMQQQLDMLAHAVAELRQERQTLRSSLTLLEATAAPVSHHADTAQQQPPESRDATAQQHHHQQQFAGASAGVAAAVTADVAWVAAVPEAASGDPLGFSGQVLQEQYHSLAPSRAVMQQLHEAGMTSALPADIQARLQAQSALNSLSLQPQQRPPPQQWPINRMAALRLDVEARDPRTASDVVLQLLALRPAASQAGPAAPLPSSVYFTLQFYKSGPVVTSTCLLAASAGAPQLQQAHQQHQQALQGYSTLMLLPQRQGAATGSPPAAGLVLKFRVDGSRPSELLPGQDAAQGAAEAHIAFCRYLLGRRLAVDVWDGESLLQVGSCTTDLAGLLRQGRDLSDLLLELPLLKHSDDAGVSTGHTQLGTLVLRLINVGKQPSNTMSSAAADAGMPATPGTPGKKVCVRAAPLQPGSPVARELRGGSSPFAVDWQQQHSGSSTGVSGGGQSPDVSASTEAVATAADIIGFEQRKLARGQRLRELVHSPTSSPQHSAPGTLQWRFSPGQQSPAGKLSAATWSHSSPFKGHQQQQWRPGSPLSTLAAEDGAAGSEGEVEPFKALQQQLFSDVDAVRKRQKPDFIRSQLRKSLVTHCTIRPSPGQALLLEHTLTNSIGRDAVFELRVSHPQELVALESLQELRGLQQGACSTINTAAAAAGGFGPAASPGGKAVPGAAAAPLKLRQLAQQAVAAGGAAVGGRQLVSTGRIFLAAHESVSIPFRFMLQPNTPTGVADGSSRTSTRDRHPQQQLQPQPHAVVVEFVPLGLAWPVSILELAVQPEPAVVDRTLRYSCPERDLLHVEVPLEQLPGVSTELLEAAAAGKLLVAASLLDVGVSVHARGPATAGAAGPALPPQQQAQRQQEQGRAHEQQQQQHYVRLRHKCGAAHEAVQFYVWLYGDSSMAQPLEAWQVFVHPLQRVDMRATIGQQSSTTLAIAGGSTDRMVAVYSSQPGELQASPAMLPLAAGGIAALGLVFKPRLQGQQRVRVHLVDIHTQQLVHGLIVCTDAHLPPLHTQMEVTVHAGGVSQHQLEVANTTSRDATYAITTNTPWLLSVSPSSAQHIPAGGRRMLSLVCDARALAVGATECGLVFISNAQSSLQHEECVVVTMHVV